MKDKLIYISISIGVLTYQFWSYMPRGFFYKGMALFILMLSFVIYSDNRNKFVYFLLFCLSINNCLDEFFFDPTKNDFNEIVATLLIPVIWYYKNKRNARKINAK